MQAAQGALGNAVLRHTECRSNVSACRWAVADGDEAQGVPHAVPE